MTFTFLKASSGAVPFVHRKFDIGSILKLQQLEPALQHPTTAADFYHESALAATSVSVSIKIY